MRVGFGYDIHPLVPGRKLILGGLVIPFEKGLNGHSDADVLCHAISDAFLGAAAIGDIGEHFPDSDEAYKDASSLELLGRVGEMLREHAYQILNLDATIVAEKPKLSPYKDEMTGNIASVLLINQGQISIKATTNEGFGSVGSGEAIAAFAVSAVMKKV